MKICENCHKNSVFGKDKLTGIGYCKSCQWKRTDIDKRSIAVKGLEKALAKQKIHKGTFVMPTEDIVIGVSSFVPSEDELNSSGNVLWDWYLERRKEMTGKCSHCGEKSCKDNDKYFHYSIAHILEKSTVPSVATNVNNWVELCHFGNGCHSMMDRKLLSLINMNCFDEIVNKLVKMYPSIAPQERRRIPSVLLEYIKTEL